MADLHWADVMQSLPARAPTGTQPLHQGTMKVAKQKLVINAAGLLVPASAAPPQPEAAGAERDEQRARGLAYDDIKIGAPSRSARRAAFFEPRACSPAVSRGRANCAAAAA